MVVSENHIFVDTNVLIGFFAGMEDDVNALRYLFLLKGKRLFTSALSVAQLASVFQKSQKNETIRKMISQIRQKFEIISFEDDDIANALKITNCDIEDNMQYVQGVKLGCFYFVTNNRKDYTNFIGIYPLKSKDVREISR